MSMVQTTGGDYCSELVRTRDEDRWLAAQYAPEKNRSALIALYAFHCELRKIPGAVSEPPLGEIRLQWWREALQEIRDAKAPRAHPVVETLAQTGVVQSIVAEKYDAVIDASARPLYGEGFSDITDLAGWLKEAEGGVDAIAATLLGGDEAIAEAARCGGGAFALAREGAGLAPNLSNSIAPEAKALWRGVRSRLSQSDAVAPALLHLALTPVYLKRGRKLFPVRKRLHLFTAMALGRF